MKNCNKKIFEAPLISVLEINAEDILTASESWGDELEPDIFF